ncbi:MAG: hypothetical protein AAGC55_00830 [Myxococcota bacterium]
MMHYLARGRMVCRWAIIAHSIALGVLLSPAEAGAQDLSQRTVLFARAGSLWQIPATGKGQPVEVVRVGAEVRRIQVASTGRLVVIEHVGGVKWASLPAPRGGSSGGPPKPPVAAVAKPLDCAGPPQVSPHLSPYLSGDGSRVVCVSARAGVGVVVHRLWPIPQSKVHSKERKDRIRHLGFLPADRLLVGDSRSIWSAAIGRPGERTTLVPESPSAASAIAPNGRRAVALYTIENGEKPVLFTFRLDGKAVRRQLLPGAVPLGWSADSRWVTAQMGSRACMIRAIGGQYKCWRGYRAVALAPDGSYLLMTKVPGEDADTSRKSAGSASSGKATDTDSSAAQDKAESVATPVVDLYRGRRDGVRPAPPRLVMRGVTGPAAWLP